MSSNITESWLPVLGLREFHSISADMQGSGSLNKTPPWSSTVLDRETNEDFRESGLLSLLLSLCYLHRARRTSLLDSAPTDSPVQRSSSAKALLERCAGVLWKRNNVEALFDAATTSLPSFMTEKTKDLLHVFLYSTYPPPFFV